MTKRTQREYNESDSEKKKVVSFTLDPDVISFIEKTKPKDRSSSWHVNSILRSSFGINSDQVSYGTSQSHPQQSCGIVSNYSGSTETPHYGNLSALSFTDSDINILKKRLGLDKSDK